MNILQIISSFPPAYDYGGPPRSAYNLSKSLVDHGNNVTVFTTDALNSEQRVNITANPEIQDGIEITRFRNVSNALSWKNIPFAPRMMIELLRTARHFDVIHSHEYRSFHTLFAHLISQRYNIPHVLQPRGSIPRFEDKALKPGFDKIAGKKIAYAADRIIVSSNIESNQFDNVIPKLKPETTVHIPNGISSNEYNPLPEAGEFRKHFNIDQNDEIILFLSRLHPQKGGDLLLEAASELLSEGDRTLVFAGPDEGHQDELKQKASEYGVKDNVLFSGPLYDENKLKVYVDADVFVLPSKYESFGNVAVEAMACGTPPIITDVCGVAEWIDHDDCLIVPQDANALQNGIRYVLNKPIDTESLRDYVWKTFSWDTVAQQTELVYSEVIQ